MGKMWNLTDISRIGHIKRTGNEWSVLSKRFDIVDRPQMAVIRVESEGVCGIFINGIFSTGRLPERVTCVEVTSLLHKGQNTLCLQLGAHYFQTCARENRARKAWRCRILYICAVLDAMRYEYRVTHFSGTKEDYFQLTQFSGNFLTDNAEAQRYFQKLFVLYHNIENNGVNGSTLAPVGGVKILDAYL